MPRKITDKLAGLDAEMEAQLNELRKQAHEGDPAERIYDLLRCELTDAEVRERADRCARAVKERDQAEADRQAANKTAKGAIELLDVEIRELAHEIREHATYREVICVERKELEGGLMQTVRLDTGEVVRERPLTQSERQQALFPRPVGEVGDGLI